MNLKDGFGRVTSGVAWLSVMLRAVQFLAFSDSAAWRKLTFAALATALLVIAVTSGMQL